MSYATARAVQLGDATGGLLLWLQKSGPPLGPVNIRFYSYFLSENSTTAQKPNQNRQTRTKLA